MNKSATLALALTGAFVLVACSEAPTGAPAVEEMAVELDAKGGNPGGEGGGGGPTDPTATFILPETGSGLLSDGGGDYVNGNCGVEGRIFATEAASNSGDATLNTKKGKCIRRVKIVFGPDDVEQVRVFINVNNIHNTTTIIPLEQEVTRGMNVNPWEGSRCEVLHFRETLADGTPTQGGQSVTVGREAANTWRVYNQPGSDTAACRLSDGSFVPVTVPVDFTIVSSDDLPV